MEHYGTEEALEGAFVSFANKVPFYGAVVACLDDPRVQGLLPRFKKRTITYGLSAQAEVSARHLTQGGGRSRFEVLWKGQLVGEVELTLPGQHNALNALAAFAVGVELGVEPQVACRALAGFSGVDRRSQVKGEARGIVVMDDYGHHPSEIRAVLKALRDSWDRRIVAVFQPHRYTRTADLFDRFLTAFYAADLVVVTGIYPAGEAPIPGVSAEALAEGMRAHGHKAVRYVADVSEVPAALEPELAAGDLVVTLGAGNVWQAGEALLKRLKGG
jgi:UDP-N-acetylmuramate--alanine ligase